MTEDIISLADARSRGLKFYFTGLACRAGHISKRITAKRACAICNAIQDGEQRARHKEKRNAAYRAWRLKNLERLAEYRKEYIAKNREKNSETCRAWRARNGERLKQIKRAWQTENKEVQRQYNRKRRALRLGASGSHTLEELQEILRLQKNKCAHCRRRFNKNLPPTLDHIIALSKGGSNHRSNLQYMCSPCNGSKWNRDPIDFARREGMLL